MKAIEELLAWLRSWQRYYDGQIAKHDGHLCVQLEPLISERDLFKARADALSALIAESGWRATHRHEKSGGDYQVIARGLDCTNARPAEEREVAIYRNEDGRWFCRQVREFDDGRFVPLPLSPS